MIEPRRRETAGGNRFLHGAPRLAPVAAVAETAVAGKGVDVVESRFQRPARVPQPKLPHAGCVDDDAAGRPQHQLPVHRRMAAAAGAAVDAVGLLALAAQQVIDD